jgi:hypothetical protein
MVFMPPMTRLEIGQEMKVGLRSISVTWTPPSLHMRRYLATVAPP